MVGWLFGAPYEARRAAQAHDRILRVARTIADLDATSQLAPKRIAEAIQYRTLDRTFWA
jgi:magnesium chelatase family protein